MYWIMGILGLVFVAAPFVLGYMNNIPALWTSIIIGVVVVAVSALEAIVRGKEKWEYQAAGILGILAVVAPFMLGFNVHVTAMWTSIVLGVLIILAASSQLFTGSSGTRNV